MFKRALTRTIEQALSRSPVVLLTGARQTGKTTLIKEIGNKEGYHYVTFDDIRILSAAQTDPVGFIAGIKKPVILDEVQRVPQLFLAIKQDVDEHRKPGRYALTGSANPLLIPRLGDSLVGRMEIFTLYPLSQGELNNRKDVFVDMLFNTTRQETIIQPISRDELYEKIEIGGYPLVQNVDSFARESWFSAYVTTLLQRDVKDLADVSGLTQLPNLLHLIATRVGSLLNVAELSRTSGMAATTLHRYLSLLETVFLIKFLPPWSANLGKRFVKSPKVYLSDTGLLSFLLGIHLQSHASDAKMGALLENFVINELFKQVTWSKTRTKIFYSRTTSGVGVDCVLENSAGDLVGIEIKNSQTVTAQDFKGLQHFAELVGDKFVRGVVLYTGTEHIPFGKRLHALPVGSLWITSTSLT